MAVPDDAAERRLVSAVYERWGDAILAACSKSSVPPAFVGALVCGESGGDANATRFEPEVYDRLKAQYPNNDDDWHRRNATSYGLCQVMGERVVGDPRKLLDPEMNLNFALGLMARNAEDYGLDLRKDFRDMFTVYNTGHRNGITADPDYAENGVKRMLIWKEIAESPA